MAALKWVLSLSLVSSTAWCEAPFLASSSLTSRANSQIRDGNLQEAIFAALDSLTQIEGRLGSENTRAAMARRNYGVALWHARLLPQAELELRRSLEVLQRHNASREHQDRVSMDLASLLGEQGQELAAAALLIALASGQSSLAQEAAPLAILALVQGGAPERAKGLYLKHISVASSKSAWDLRLAWAQALGRLGQWNEAEREVRRSAIDGEKFFGAGHPALAPAWELCAEAIEAQGDKAKAKLYWEKALEARARYAGLINLASLPHQRAKAKILRKLGQAAEATKLSKQIDEFEKINFENLTTSR